MTVGWLLGAVLAGGEGRRIGGDKALVSLAGRPLIEYPLIALREIADQVVVVAKPTTILPELPEVELWIEPNDPVHPLAGVVHALRRGNGRAVLVCACDLPLITAATLRAVLEADDRVAPAIVARGDGRLQPLVALYRPVAYPALRAAAEGGVASHDAVAGLDPVVVDIADPEAFINVNVPEDLLLAADALERRSPGLNRT